MQRSARASPKQRLPRARRNHGLRAYTGARQGPPLPWALIVPPSVGLQAPVRDRPIPRPRVPHNDDDDTDDDTDDDDDDDDQAADRPPAKLGSITRGVITAPSAPLHAPPPKLGRYGRQGAITSHATRPYHALHQPTGRCTRHLPN